MEWEEIEPYARSVGAFSLSICGEFNPAIVPG